MHIIDGFFAQSDKAAGRFHRGRYGVAFDEDIAAYSMVGISVNGMLIVEDIIFIQRCLHRDIEVPLRMRLDSFARFAANSESRNFGVVAA